MKSGLKVVTEPVVEPITIQEAKLHVRVEDDQTSEDTLINGLIRTARISAEAFLRRALATQTWNLVLDAFPGSDTIELPLPPLQSVVSITYKLRAGTTSTFASSNYVVGTSGEPGRIRLVDGVSWPGDELYPLEAVTIQFICGYGAAGAIPQHFKQGMLLLIGHWYENRESVIPNQVNELPQGVKWLWWVDRFMRFS